jgi:hypothetical protein
VAETNALLKRHTGNRIEGSNPSVSANLHPATVRDRPENPHKSLQRLDFCSRLNGIVRGRPEKNVVLGVGLGALQRL